jgi:uncharacterized membrane protein YvbJ
MNCPNCGKWINEKDSYCGKCGFQLINKKNQTVVKDIENKQEEETNKPDTDIQSDYMKAEKKVYLHTFVNPFKTGFFLTLGITLAIILLIICLSILFSVIIAHTYPFNVLLRLS